MSKKINTHTLYAFSGKMHSGKDFVAKTAGLGIIGFADPIYEIVKYYTGTADKSVPGIRKMMQYVGQVGWGCVSETYPFTPERATLTEQIRINGGMMSEDFQFVNWEQYGRRQDFWVNILLQRLGLRPVPTFVKRVPEFGQEGEILLTRTSQINNALVPENVAVTNVRFDHELEPLAGAGFQHYHVMCSEETRQRRMREAGYVVKAEEQNDTSEALAKRLDTEMPEEWVIWNDDAPVPPGKGYLIMADFLHKVSVDRRPAGKCWSSGLPVNDPKPGDDPLGWTTPWPFAEADPPLPPKPKFLGAARNKEGLTMLLVAGPVEPRDSLVDMLRDLQATDILDRKKLGALYKQLDQDYNERDKKEPVVMRDTQALRELYEQLYQAYANRDKNKPDEHPVFNDDWQKETMRRMSVDSFAESDLAFVELIKEIVEKGEAGKVAYRGPKLTRDMLAAVKAVLERTQAPKASDAMLELLMKYSDPEQVQELAQAEPLKMGDVVVTKSGPVTTVTNTKGMERLDIKQA